MRCFYAFIIPILLISCDRAASDIIGGSHYDVLMLGNSYTQQNGGIDQQLRFLFDSASGISGECEKLTAGGLRLSQHAIKWGGSGLDTKTYDFVILQDQSKVPSFPSYVASYQASRDGAIVLDERIEKAGAETIFFLTWGYRFGDLANAWLSPDYLSMQSNLLAGYRGYANAITTPTRKPYIAPVGLAFKKIYDDIVAEGGTPTDGGTLFYSLYSGDNSHPTRYATYLASCVIFSTITGVSTIDMPDNFGIDDSTRFKLQQAADWAVFDDKSLGFEYPWESSNVEPPVQPEFPIDTPVQPEFPIETPVTAPSAFPSRAPTKTPSTPPTKTKSAAPTENPSVASSTAPTITPSTAPTEHPSVASSTAPTKTPSMAPTKTPSMAPTKTKSAAPSGTPSVASSTAPTKTLSTAPTGTPSVAFSMPPTKNPSAAPTRTLSVVFTETPSTTDGNIAGDDDWPNAACVDNPSASFPVDPVVGTAGCAFLSLNMERYSYLCQLLKVAYGCPSTCDACAYFK